MNKMLLLVAAAGLMVLGEAALGVDKPPKCYKADTAPDAMEGQVVKVDAGQGRLTLRAADGSMHEFQVSQETLADYKVGDTMKAKLKSGPAVRLACDRRQPAVWATGLVQHPCGLDKPRFCSLCTA